LRPNAVWVRSITLLTGASRGAKCCLTDVGHHRIAVHKA
jgi:hypothetical protein